MKKAAIIGCGGIGHYHLGHLMKFDDIEIAGLCDLTLAKAEGFRELCGSGKTYTNFIEMYDEVEPDFVFICVPPTCHGRIEFETIRRSIPFFVEKPVALDMDLGREILRQVNEKQLTTAVGFQCRYDSINSAAKKFVEDEKIVTVAASRVGGIPDADWWAIKSTCGGQLAEQSIHQVDILRYMLGEIKTVYSVPTRGFITQEDWHGYFNDDLSTSIFVFESGISATMMTGCYSQNGASWDSKMTFGGIKSRMDYRLCSSVTLYGIDEKDIAEQVDGTIGGDGTQKKSDKETGITVKNENDFGIDCDRTFIDAVISGDTSKIRSPYADGLRSVAVTLACNESMRTGKAVEVEY